MTNPYRPGAGHMPPHLAGREKDRQEFQRLLRQDTILENMVLTGLRGVGKTVLLETFKPLAVTAGWLWVGTDLSESSSVSEESLVTRLLTDLSVVTSSIVVAVDRRPGLGFGATPSDVRRTLDFNALASVYRSTPGLASDKFKSVLELVWAHLARSTCRGIVFAYDEAQNLSDHSQKEQYPLSVLLDVFQSIQRKGIPFMLVLTGLPTLFPKLVEARTFAERMFRVVFLDRLTDEESREAIVRPVADLHCPFRFTESAIEQICANSDGYPYFIQFICREVFDLFSQQILRSRDAAIPVHEIIRKLDTDFFAGRWARATDRQRELLTVIASLDNCDREFAVQEIVAKSNEMLDRPFSASHVNQMLATLAGAGLIFKNRYGKYSFAVPLLGQYIRRQAGE